MIRVEIKPSQVTFDSRSGVSAKTGKEYKMFEQLGYAWLGGDYPELIKINLEEGQPPYQAGFYTLHPSSFRVGSYNQLQIGRLALIPEEKK